MEVLFLQILYFVIWGHSLVNLFLFTICKAFDVTGLFVDDVLLQLVELLVLSNILGHLICSSWLYALSLVQLTRIKYFPKWIFLLKLLCTVSFNLNITLHVSQEIGQAILILLLVKWLITTRHFETGGVTPCTLCLTILLVTILWNLTKKLLV